jgi:membrane protein YdbS with pleckstrin-like domain
LLAALVLALVAAAMTIAWRRWKSTSWKLDATGLHVRRGRLWRKEILIPRSRVQHLDIERGPIERHFGLATLIVHTAGTRQHALRQPGLADADAVALRDVLVPASDSHDDVL